MSIATKRGDEGQTDLMFGRRVSKTHPRIVANGTIDEMNAALGTARACSQHEVVQTRIAEIQADLINVMGELATDRADLEKYREKGFSITEDSLVERLDGWVHELENDHGVNFMKWSTPGAAGSSAAAGLDLARTICRRAERDVIALVESGDVENFAILRFLNRLSDILWLLARLEERD
ncbi:MAG: cob(I)alamin adenosyltransferase [Verrucomicrobiales bacterium]|jgi:cob(I)alamin adenosyltransferase